MLKANVPCASMGAELKFRRAHWKNSTPFGCCSTISLSHTNWVYLVYNMHYTTSMYNRATSDITWGKEKVWESQQNKKGKDSNASSWLKSQYFEMPLAEWQFIFMPACLEINNWIFSAFDSGVGAAHSCSFAPRCQNTAHRWGKELQHLPTPRGLIPISKISVATGTKCWSLS